MLKEILFFLIVSVSDSCVFFPCLPMQLKNVMNKYEVLGVVGEGRYPFCLDPLLSESFLLLCCRLLSVVEFLLVATARRIVSYNYADVLCLSCGQLVSCLYVTPS